MSKQERKRAEAAEVERRAEASGVPSELQVYAMGKHHSDEGGPRCYVPVKVSEMLAGGQDSYDRTLWPRLLQAALKEGTPIHVEPDDSRMYRNGRTPIADLCDWGHGSEQVLMLNARAHEVLKAFLRGGCRPVPLRCTTAEVFGYLVKSQDVLNEAQCKGSWITKQDGSRVAIFMDQYAFDTEKLGQQALFRVPQRASEFLALQPMVDAAEAHGLTGYRYKRIWPHASVPHVVAIPVKKLPAGGVGGAKKPAAPVLSTDSRKVAVPFLEGLLGSPLMMDGKPPAEVIGYELPKVAIPSGAIVGVDLLLTEEKPFVRRVKPGSYELMLIAARARRDERIAFAMLRFAERPVARWEPAVITGKKKSDGGGRVTVMRLSPAAGVFAMRSRRSFCWMGRMRRDRRRNGLRSRCARRIATRGSGPT